MWGEPSGRVLVNPYVVKAARARLRWKHMLSWGIVVMTITGFVCAIVYLVQTEQEFATPEQAARWTLLPVIIIQAVVLMLLGTGAVAAGIAQERDQGLLDYQRMTPMSPTAKLLGYLFGLPVREYFLFALTLPFLAFGVIRGGYPIATVLHFYAIFFSSVLVYHMTGMAAGMASSKPRLAGLFAQGMVLILYFALPNLSHLGLTFFEFLTIRPALFGLITEEIERLGSGVEMIVQSRFTALDSFRDIPFFGTHLHPSVYTLLVQGALIASLWTIVHRKWRDEHAHPFSKTFGVAFFAGASTLLLGSVWPILRDDSVLAQLVGHFDRLDYLPVEEIMQQPEVPIFMAMMLTISTGVLGATGILTLLLTTPTRHKISEGWRRATRLGKQRVSLASDAASSLPLALACVGIMGGVIGVLAWIAVNSGRFESTPSLWVLAAPVVYVSLVLVFLQGTLERFGKRAFFVSAFLLWMVPFFMAVLLGAAFENEVASAYVSLPFPPIGLFFMTLGILESAVPSLDMSDGPTEVLERIGALTAWGVAGYTMLASAAVFASVRQQRRLARAAFLELDGAESRVSTPIPAGVGVAVEC